jgi:hypothetical protein
MRACGWAALATWHGPLPAARGSCTAEGEGHAPKRRGVIPIAWGRRSSLQKELPGRAVFLLAGMPKWRNWQTRYIQGVVPVRAWRFESSLRHQLINCLLSGSCSRKTAWCLTDNSSFMANYYFLRSSAFRNLAIPRASRPDRQIIHLHRNLPEQHSALRRRDSWNVTPAMPRSSCGRFLGIQAAIGV